MFWGNSLKREFSPHTRGCSYINSELKDGEYVFPAYAGMFTSPDPTPPNNKRFPRIRGDVPALPES